MDEKTALVALNMIDGIGSVKLNRLIGKFKNARSVFSAEFSALRDTEGIGPALAQGIINFDFKLAEKEIYEAGKKNINIITVFDEGYPDILKNIYDPPPVLYIAGKNIPPAVLNIGIVGTRVPTDYGANSLIKIIREMARSRVTFNVISGLARGIDTVAHIESLKQGLFTAAVLGFGINRLWPFEKNPLVKGIYNKGSIISEFPLNTLGLKQNFPRRNRVISGLSDGVLIIEAAERSGALITADCALEQGREVFALPGSIFSEKSKGTNNLISQGAKILRSAEDIIEEFGFKKNKKAPAEIKPDETEKSLSADEKNVYRVLTEEKKHIDNISIESNMDITKLNSILTFLELKGIVKQLSGKNFVKLR